MQGTFTWTEYNQNISTGEIRGGYFLPDGTIDGSETIVDSIGSSTTTWHFDPNP
jgi:hypothetical protein